MTGEGSNFYICPDCGGNMYYTTCSSYAPRSHLLEVHKPECKGKKMGAKFYTCPTCKETMHGGDSFYEWKYIYYEHERFCKGKKTETIKYKGKEWEVIDRRENPPERWDMILCLRELNPMPDIEAGDWILIDGKHHPDRCILGRYLGAADRHNVVEIRFADGRPPWRRG